MNDKMKKYLVLSIIMALSMCVLAGCSNTAQAPQPAPQPQEETAAPEDEEFVEEEVYVDEEDDQAADDQEDPDEGLGDDLEESEPYEGADPIGKWYTEDYDEEANWANSYVIELTDDGKATCTGWRNKDTGTFSTDGETVTIVFDDCQTDEPGKGFTPVEGFKYTVVMQLNGDDADITIDAPDVISNLTDGKVHRNEGAGDKETALDEEASNDIADGTYVTDEKYKGEISKDGSTITIETSLGHYDKDYNIVKDYDKQTYVFSTSKDCKCVIMQEDVQTSPVAEQIDFINEFLQGNSGLPITLVIKNGEITEISFSS